MRKYIAFFVALVAFALTAQAAVTFYQGTGTRDPLAIPGDGFALLVMDVQIGPGDTALSRPIDLLKLPINYRDTGTGDAALVPDLGAGNGILSCYDISDSAAVTDSTDITGQIYVSQYAGDNTNPYQTGESGGKNDTWATLGSAYSIDAESASSAVNEATAAITLGSQLDRFVRVRFINNNGNAKDKSRCRFYWTKKQMKH